jgi:hypothetical protein
LALLYSHLGCHFKNENKISVDASVPLIECIHWVWRWVRTLENNLSKAGRQIGGLVFKYIIGLWGIVFLAGAHFHNLCIRETLFMCFEIGMIYISSNRKVDI